MTIFVISLLAVINNILIVPVMMGIVCVCACVYIMLLQTDINECEESKELCEHNCINTNGSYYCSCNLGYVLEDNNSSCDGKLYKAIIQL